MFRTKLFLGGSFVPGDLHLCSLLGMRKTLVEDRPTGQMCWVRLGIQEMSIAEDGREQ
jgi:hypothetical protein